MSLNPSSLLNVFIDAKADPQPSGHFGIEFVITILFSEANGFLIQMNILNFNMNHTQTLKSSFKF